MSDGRRKILSVQELLGMEGNVVTMQEVFRFVQTGRASDGAVQGYFEATGLVPKCAERIRLAGVDLPPEMFERGRRMAA
jgi:pilus assembly protein CpaF